MHCFECADREDVNITLSGQPNDTENVSSFRLCTFPFFTGKTIHKVIHQIRGRYRQRDSTICESSSMVWMSCG